MTDSKKTVEDLPVLWDQFSWIKEGDQWFIQGPKRFLGPGITLNMRSRRGLVEIPFERLELVREFKAQLPMVPGQIEPFITKFGVWKVSR